VARPIASRANNGDFAISDATPSIGLVCPPSTELIAVATAVDKDDACFTCPVDVVIGEPAGERKSLLTDIVDGRSCVSEEESAERGGTAFEVVLGEEEGEVLDDEAAVGLAVVDLVPKPKRIMNQSSVVKGNKIIPIRCPSKSKTVYTFFKNTSPSSQVFAPND
jgi:hypothetical protein